MCGPSHLAAKQQPQMVFRSSFVLDYLFDGQIHCSPALLAVLPGHMLAGAGGPCPARLLVGPPAGRPAEQTRRVGAEMRKCLTAKQSATRRDRPGRAARHASSRRFLFAAALVLVLCEQQSRTHLKPQNNASWRTANCTHGFFSLQHLSWYLGGREAHERPYGRSSSSHYSNKI